MSTMAAALQAANLRPSDQVVRELAVTEQLRANRGREIVLGVTFKSDFDLNGLLAGIIGGVDCRIYLEVSDANLAQGRLAVEFVKQFLANHPELGSADASIRDIVLVTLHQDKYDFTRRWVGVHCRNATIAWDVTTAIRGVSNWPVGVKVGKITCPKVEQVFHQRGVDADNVF